MQSTIKASTLVFLLFQLHGCGDEPKSSDNCNNGDPNTRCCRIETDRGQYSSSCKTESACDAEAGNRPHIWPADNIVSSDTAGCRGK
jgi:hypothetical protein